MRLVTASPNALYCDTDEVLTPAACALLKLNGIRGVWRYLSGLSLAERDTILESGLELFFVNYAHVAGWTPSAAGGLADAERDLARLEALAIPLGVHSAFDLEGPGGNENEVVAHVSTHGHMLWGAKYISSLYVGEGSMLTSATLYALPSMLYWHSCSQLRDGSSGLEPLCGYSVFQGRPFDVVLDDGAGTIVTIDYNYVVADFKGRLPIGVAG
jgi:hypothetical protein